MDWTTKGGYSTFQLKNVVGKVGKVGNQSIHLAR